jgi:transposase
MSDKQKLIKARIGLLQLAQELGNIKAACQRAGISRSHFYEIKEAYEKHGAEGLEPKERRRPRMPNQTPPELEKQILDMTAQFPTYSYIRIADQLRLIGIGVSAPAVRGVWVRHGITLRLQRLLWLDKKTASEGGVLTEQAKRLLQKHAGRNGDPEQHIEAPHSGYLLCQALWRIIGMRICTQDRRLQGACISDVSYAAAYEMRNSREVMFSEGTADRTGVRKSVRWR